MGLEPMISRTTIWRANQLHHTHHITYRTVFCPTKYHRIKFCGSNEPGGIRTLDLRLRRPLLYPAELQTHISDHTQNKLFQESGWWESNPRIQLGRLVFYHWTTPAWRIGVTGFEPATSWSQTRRSSQAEPHPDGVVLYHFLLPLRDTRHIIYECQLNVNNFFHFFYFFFK